MHNSRMMAAFFVRQFGCSACREHLLGEDTD